MRIDCIYINDSQNVSGVHVHNIWRPEFTVLKASIGFKNAIHQINTMRAKVHDQKVVGLREQDCQSSR